MFRSILSLCALASLLVAVQLLVAADSDEQSGMPIRRVGVRDACEVLDAIQSELLESGVCVGGEAIEVGMFWNNSDADVLSVVYRIPEVLQIYREAYPQGDGLIWLADDLSYRDKDTRWSTKIVSDAKFKELLAKSTVRFSGNMSEGLSDSEKSRQAERKQRKAAAIAQP
ncbi:MAG TPA: hypothetical protein PKN33_09830 [Phycisphaerae bacterium]|nr:hypothetical protein [Phycisphaerae bacterium]